MGSNPISPTILVLDTSPLQALHRVALLAVLPAAFGRIVIPRGVYDETRVSLRLAGPRLVPDLDALPWIEVVDVSDEEIAGAGAALVKQRRSTELYRWFGRQLDRPEVEAALLARRESAVAIIEDRNGARCAQDLGITVRNVADLLTDLEQAQLIPDASEAARHIRATGYDSRALRWLDWRGPQPSGSQT